MIYRLCLIDGEIAPPGKQHKSFSLCYREATDRRRAPQDADEEGKPGLCESLILLRFSKFQDVLVLNVTS